MPLFRSATRANRLQPERRSGVRVFTLKNAAWLALSVVILFAIVSTYMERRSSGTSDYGRLYDRRIEAIDRPAPAQRPEVVHEAPEEMLDGSPAARNMRGEELLGVTPDPPATETTASAPPPVSRARRGRGDGRRITISGGADGVRLDIEPAAPPPR